MTLSTAKQQKATKFASFAFYGKGRNGHPAVAYLAGRRVPHAERQNQASGPTGLSSSVAKLPCMDVFFH